LGGFIDNGFSSLFGVPRIETSEITPNLYVGGQYRRHRLGHLADWGITGIVNMRTTPTKAGFEKFDIDYIQIPVRDRAAPRLEQLKTGVKFINKQINQGGKVYVHCQWGRGRGPTMAAAYLIDAGFGLEKAIEMISEKRPFMRLTKRQRKALEEFQSKCYSGVA